ncbi:MAG TPA: hypothetical protein PLU45_05055, partial [Bacteroidales bacterium]|nr:hypothetical protein [Bacteroidales bacterium]
MCTFSTYFLGTERERYNILPSTIGVANTPEEEFCVCVYEKKQVESSEKIERIAFLGKKKSEKIKLRETASGDVIQSLYSTIE